MGATDNIPPIHPSPNCHLPDLLHNPRHDDHNNPIDSNLHLHTSPHQKSHLQPTIEDNIFPRKTHSEPQPKKRINPTARNLSLSFHPPDSMVQICSLPKARITVFPVPPLGLRFVLRGLYGILLVLILGAYLGPTRGIDVWENFV